MKTESSSVVLYMADNPGFRNFHLLKKSHKKKKMKIEFHVSQLFCLGKKSNNHDFAGYEFFK